MLGVIAGDPRGESHPGRRQTRRDTSVSVWEGGGRLTPRWFALGGEVQEAVCSLQSPPPVEGAGDPSGLPGSGQSGLGGGHFPLRVVFPCQAGCGVRWLGVPLSPPSILCPVPSPPQGGEGRMHLSGQSPSAGLPRNPVHTSGVGFSKASRAFPVPVGNSSPAQWTAAPPGSEKTLAQPAAPLAPPRSQGQCWKERSLAGSERTEETYQPVQTAKAKKPV